MLECEACGFTMAEVVKVLGDDLVRLGRLTDRAHCLRLGDSKALERCLEEFEARFPQVFVAVYFGVLPSALSLNELTFWLLNHAAFDTDDFRRLNEYAIVLVIDPVAKEVGLNVGYALEQALPPRFLLKVVTAMRTPLWHGEYVGAVGQILNGVGRRLRKGAKRVSPGQELSPPESAEEFMRESGLNRLRESVGENERKRDVQKTGEREKGREWL